MTSRSSGSALLLLGLLTAGCARQRFFQPDARVPGAQVRTASPDSARVTAGRHYRRGFLHQALFGQHYRPVWAQPVTLPVLDLGRVVPGGLTPGKIGGGFQTTSMTLNSPSGRAYALRSLDKDPYKTLPKVLRHTFMLNVVRDATSAGNPYGAFVVPPLAQAAGVLHTTPRPFYVRADETQLGEASERFRGKVVLLEQKFEGKDDLGLKFGPGAVDLEESDDVLSEVYADAKHRLDQPAFLRARLLDLWLGDWDRHEGQWDWVAYEQPQGRTLYRPVPIDRDQVFFRFSDGLISWLISRPWAVAKFRTFKPRYESIEGYARNAHFIDARALNELPLAQYQAATRAMQQALTDEVISQAARRLPPEVYQLEGARLENALKARREKLPQAALEFYRLQSREVLIPGTDEKERFVVDRQSDTLTVVSVFSLSDDQEKPETLLYQRGFRPAETKRLVLHGLGEEDVFEVKGKVRRSPLVDIYGGPNEDRVKDESRVAGLRRKTRYFDTKRNNEVEPAPELNIKTTRGVASYAFDRDGSGR
ncbi:hypothetical protein D3Y59_04680 [Hymenobacter oligotrophus]|uniref:Uncharacterized protein n=1 Tax=Hymenobacter oligotrophus TaxID=2319843 RepID=A0A3B7QYY7_9BACT|nr:hypothetical protein [Hymenobacter oligotrophus]AYA36413.1 hypothetical protein D3Y59_04680 [Hymenobacter oligotrophus]